MLLLQDLRQADAASGGTTVVKQNRDMGKKSRGGGGSEGEAGGDSLLHGWGTWDARDGAVGAGAPRV